MASTIISNNSPYTFGQMTNQAVNQLNAAWQMFWTAARPYIEQLDNGTYSM
jgi:hypothetical protein